MITDYGGGVTMSVGPGSVATPGIVPAFAVAAEQYAGLWEAQGIDEAQQVVLAEQVLAESAATQCPDQSERVTESFGG